MAEKGFDGAQQQPITDSPMIQRLGGLVADAAASSASKPIQVAEGGAMMFDQTSELMGSQPTIDLARLKAGDVIWWRDDKDQVGFFRIEAPASKRVRAKGVAKFVDASGDPVEETVEFNGSTVGTSLLMNKLSKNLHVEVAVPGREISDSELTVENVTDRYPTLIRSSMVVDMGIIQAQQVAQDTA
jgi:hypothetical protein